jgi:hypothetical protein
MRFWPPDILYQALAMAGPLATGISNFARMTR